MTRKKDSAVVKRLLTRGRRDAQEQTAQTICVPCYGIVVRLNRAAIAGESGGGIITSDLHEPAAGRDYSAAVDAIESLVLAHACAGIDIASPAYVEGIETAVTAIANQL